MNLCLQVIQRLITAQVLDGKGAKYVVETMWMLMEAGLEEVSKNSANIIMIVGHFRVHISGGLWGARCTWRKLK